MTDLFILRHAQTGYNAAGVLQGHIDSVLTDNGRDQAKAAGKALASGRPFDVVFSSDLSRCVETADIILKETNAGEGVSVPKVITDKRWRERFMGELEGLPIGEARLRARMEGKKFHDYGESSTSTLERNMKAANEALAEIRESKPHRALIVSHGSVIPRVLHKLVDEGKLSLMDGITEKDIRVPANTAISHIRVDPDSSALLRLNDSAHLGKIGKVNQELL